MALYWALTAIGLVLAAAVGFLAENAYHEHKGLHCRCPVHLIEEGIEAAAAAPAPDALGNPAPAPEPPFLEPLPEPDGPAPSMLPVPPASWPALYGPRIMALDRLTHVQLLDMLIYVSGYAPEAVDQALQLLREDPHRFEP